MNLIKDKIIFLDRDGTINKEDGYITKPDQLKLYDGTLTALKMLDEIGYRIVIVSNQAGVGRGLLTEAKLQEINAALLGTLKGHGIEIEKLYYCPHHPDASVPEYKKDCECRKPKTGMIMRARTELDVQVQGAYMIGDKLTDIELAHNFGGRGILLLTGYGTKERGHLAGKPYAPVYIAKDIIDAVNWIRNQSPKNS